MVFLRSLTFHIIFYAMNIILCFAMLWVLILPRRMAFNVIFTVYFRPIYWLERRILGLDFMVEGQENLPQSGSYIIAMKHQSAYETLKLFHLFGDIRIILKKELLYLPLWGWYATKFGMIGVDRGAKGRAMHSILDNAKPVIEAGVPILIYPQGTRVRIGQTVQEKPYKQGAIRLYEHFNIPIIPVAVNSGKFWPRRAFLIRGGIVRFKILPAIPPGQDSAEVFESMQSVIEAESEKLLKDSHSLID